MREFWLKVLRAGSGVSSKRLMGIVCVCFAMIFACLGLFLGEVGVVDGIVSTIVIEFLAAGVALFGITGWERRNRYTPPVQEQQEPEQHKSDNDNSDNDNEEILDAEI